eukprot:TRINITY_DN915_c0_g1_i3.p1 TRINITY_DN915_c0_g1~~TRINITY_DN915_c0_g1_i3.p1  ORF type:complete len:518 (-),score=77.98 TRINITY_DN915_c0_g1_i3:336-1889(-)
MRSHAMERLTLAWLLAVVHSAVGLASPNILYLVADDLRPQLGSYGHGYMHTPNLDQLAATSLQFERAYTNFAYCAPSRNSFLSGRRPDRTRALNFLTTFRDAAGADSWIAMPEFFKRQGYFTSSAGKVYHDHMDDDRSWSYPSNQTHWIQCGAGDMIDPNGNYCGVTNSSVIPYTDEDMILEQGLARLDLAVNSGKPWWVSIGVHRPHTSYRVPEGFYGTELYPEHVLPPQHPGPPENAPFMSGNWEGGDINDTAHGCPGCVVPSSRAVEYRKWYYGAVSWTDHNMGRALDKLVELGEENRTIVVFHSDHGYQLGELNEWSKKTDTELATRVPLLIRVPWAPASHGQRTKAVTELVDLYRTLADLAGFQGMVQPGVQGTSVAQLFEDPTAASLANKRGYSQIGRCACGMYPSPGGSAHECGANACARVELGSPLFEFMGYSMRTDLFRYTAWVRWDNSTLKVDWSRVEAQELYDLSDDPGTDFDFAGYSHNLAGNPVYGTMVSQFQAELEEEVNSWY